jgi:hypothetical protein
MGVTFGKGDDFWRKQVDGVFTVVLGYKKEPSGGHTVTWKEGGKLKESFEWDTLADAREEIKLLFHQAQQQKKIVSLSSDARRLFKKPTWNDVRVQTWEERDRVHIWVHYKDDHPIMPMATVAEWWDDDARQMFEDGFFKGGRQLETSVLKYCQDVGLIEKKGW